MQAIARLVPLLVQASLFLLVFALGLRATPADGLYLLRRPAQLARALLAMHVVVPLFTALLVAALPLRPAVKLTLVLMAASPVPPILPGKQLKLGGRMEYVFGLLVAVSLLAVVVVPLTIALLALAFDKAAVVAPGAVALVVARTVLLPLALGIVVRYVAPTFAALVAAPAALVGNVLLLLGLLPILVVAWRPMVALVGQGTLLAVTAVVVVALAAGHLLGGPDPGDRATLALASASRHPGVALLVTTTNFPEYRSAVTAAVLLYLIASIVLTIPYGAWRKRHYALAAPGAAAPAGRHV